jgi:hypothetical protein
MPHCPYRWTFVVSVKLLQYPRAFEVPKEKLAIAVAAANKASIRADSDVACVTGNVVTLHLLLPLEPVPLPRLVYNN